MPAFRRLACLPSLVALPLIAALPTTQCFAADVASPIYGYQVDRDQVDVDQVEVDQGQGAETAALDASELECMAKVVLHEAGHEPRSGKVAVAQTLMNRLAARRFGGSVCQVANQRGQFFNTAAFHPDRDGAAWTDAMAVSRAVLGGQEEDVAPGAMFFRASASRASSFLRGRQRIAAVGAQVFYR